MKPSVALSRWSVVVSLALVFCLAVAGNAPVGAAVYPGSMAALGDSITQAFNTGSSSLTDAPQNSWSTGTSASVNSLYLRLRTLNPALNGQNFNYAVTGAKMGALQSQAARVTGSIQYVTILMGGNDVCTTSESNMTAVATFRSQFEAAMNTLKTNAPNAQIYVVSIPSVYNLWSVLKGNFWARLTWGFGGICQSMLVNPTSTSAADQARRERVRQRNVDFNTQLQQVCALYANCRFDNNAAYNTVFAASNVSTRDYFHPSVSGQALLASKAWGASGFAP